RGVMVEHRSLVNLCFWHNRRYSVTFSDRATKYAGIGFDASVWEMFPYFICGASLYIVPEEIKFDVHKLARYFETHHITIGFLPTQVCEQFMLQEKEPRSLRVLLTGGDKLRTFSPRSYRLYNNYGPTENTVVTTSYPVVSALDNIPVGKPVDNCRVYILDKDGRAQPVGIPGELCISGAGLARGYLNRPELTVEHFTPLYRTGDSARWLADGNIEFLGRIDSQVKVRGFRIELGEIETQLMGYDQVKEAVVIAKENETGDKYLIAYIVEAFIETPLETPQLKKYLSQTLPGYMIPSYFVQLAEIPVTPNGKVDVKALPEPGIETGEPYQPAGDEIEEILIEVWSHVLGRDALHASQLRESIGINDNFFELGGDSIKAIQVSAGMRSRGLKLDVGELFLKQTIRQLKKCIKPIDRVIPQGAVSGEVPLTPIQRWFFRNNFTRNFHFNQSVLICKEDGFAEDVLEKVFNALAEHHDVLRMVYYPVNREGRRDLTVVQENRGLEGKRYDLEVFDFRDKNDVEKEIEKESGRIQRGIDLGTGPLVKLGLFKTSRGHHLLIAVHHLVIDGVSWRIFFDDLAAAYRQVERGEAVKLPEKTDSFKYWSQRLLEYAAGEEVLKELDYWREIETAGVSCLPRDFDILPEKRKFKNSGTLGLRLDKGLTGRLLTEVNHAYSTEINDILLAALGMALKEWSRMERFVINLEGHGREGILKDVDISRTIGWFTSQFPVLLDMSKTGDLPYVIKGVKEMLRRVPNKGVGYGILRYLTPAENKEGLTFECVPEISFNYLGQFGMGNNSRDHTVFRVSGMKSGHSVSPGMEKIAAIDINGIISGEGELVLSFSYIDSEYKRCNIEALVDGCKTNLVKIIEHCTKKEEKELTPSDLTYSDFSIDELKELTGKIGDLVTD
ncbi:MAG: AMP-binding protein, partial [bacterium]|nr:AMP-binding protein [bacterium]